MRRRRNSYSTPSGGSAFLEVNTRLQVEHGVTELVTDIDIVREQLCLAAGARCRAASCRGRRSRADPSRHAIEVRISAEDPARGFAPTPGRIGRWIMPRAQGSASTRLSRRAIASRRTTTHSSPSSWSSPGSAPRASIACAARSTRSRSRGIQTTLPFHRVVAHDAAFRAGDLSTDWVADRWDRPSSEHRAAALDRAAASRGRSARLAPTGVGHRPGPCAKTRHRRPSRSVDSVGARGRHRPVAAVERCPREPASGSSRRRRAGSRPTSRATSTSRAGSRRRRRSARVWSAPRTARRPTHGRARRHRGRRRRLAVRARGGGRCPRRACASERPATRARCRGRRAAEIRAIIPGRVVVRRRRSPGDAVEAGQRAPGRGGDEDAERAPEPRVPGRVKRVAVGAGQTVEIGDLLSSSSDGARRRAAPPEPPPTGERRTPSAIAGGRRLAARPSPRAPERRERFETTSGIEIQDLYTAADRAGLDEDTDLGLPGRAPVHPRRPADDVPQPLLDDAPVRRLRHRRGDQPAVPLPPRAGPDRACRSPSTCPPRWATTRTRPRPRARSAGSASRSRASPTWRRPRRRPPARRGQRRR